MSMHCAVCGHRSNEVKTGGKLSIDASGFGIMEGVLFKVVCQRGG